MDNSPTIPIEEQFKFMADTAPVMIWIADVNKLCYFFNQEWLNFTGRTREQEFGEGWAEGVHADDLERCMDIYHTNFDTRSPFKMEYRLRYRDGTYRWVLDNGMPRYTETGVFAGYIGSCMDIQEMKEAEQLKDEFMSIASHELKTPLTALSASMQLLTHLVKTNPGSERVPLFIDKANSSLNKLINLTNELMNVSNIQAGQLQLNKTHFKVADLLNECCDHVRLLGTHDLKLTGDTEVMVYADHQRIDQVMVNLVNNAVKYAPSSKQIILHIEKQDGVVKVSVQDFGMGISKEKLPFLFDRYYRVDNTGVQFNGMGLGLYICAEIIKRHGGKTGVNSRLNEGSTFWFTLPVE